LAIEFDCYLIDEVIMVGDANFHQKCHDELFEKRSDRALILASHSPGLIPEFCNRALILDQGLATPYSDVDEALEVYEGL
jgi:capsular polysaccharide transport system ATP-binding protein